MRFKTCLHLVSVLECLNVNVIFAGPLDTCREYSKYGVPGNDGDLLCRKGHLISHDDYYKPPIWVAEHLTSQKASGTLKRKDSFKADPDLQVGKSA